MTTRRLRSTILDAGELLLSPHFWRCLLVGAALTCCVVALLWAGVTPLGLMLLAVVLGQVAVVVRGRGE